MCLTGEGSLSPDESAADSPSAPGSFGDLGIVLLAAFGFGSFFGLGSFLGFGCMRQ